MPELAATALCRSGSWVRGQGSTVKSVSVRCESGEGGGIHPVEEEHVSVAGVEGEGYSPEVAAEPNQSSA